MGSRSFQSHLLHIHWCHHIHSKLLHQQHIYCNRNTNILHNILPHSHHSMSNLDQEHHHTCKPSFHLGSSHKCPYIHYVHHTTLNAHRCYKDNSVRYILWCTHNKVYPQGSKYQKHRYSDSFHLTTFDLEGSSVSGNHRCVRTKRSHCTHHSNVLGICW